MKKILVFVLFLSLPFLAISAERGSTARAAKNPSVSTSDTKSQNARAANTRGKTSTETSNTNQKASARVSTSTTGSATSSRGSVARSVVSTTSSSSTSDNKQAYEECMDQFCSKDISEGGRCECSDEMIEYESILAKIDEADKKAKEIATVGVEKIQLGAKSEYVFTGTKTYDDDEGTKKTNQIDMSVFDDAGVNFSSITSSIFGETSSSTTTKGVRGDELYAKSQKLCLAKISNNDDMAMIKTLYEQSIAADCRTYKKYLTTRQKASEEKLATAEKAQRAAMLDSYNDANKYNRGECVLEFKKCMADTARGGCGENFENCTDSTVLKNKKYLCERITDSCIAVRDYVWNDFLKEIEPTLKTAELLNENNLLYSCLGNISTCIQKACTESLSGETTLDACLGNPDMARSFCVNYITPCEKKVPEIWDYVSAKLASMRVDACSSAVKSCITAEDACGTDYSNCVGLSTDDIKELCPTEKLVACRKDNSAQNFNSIDDIIQGLLLNVDNQSLINCMNYADESMMKVCGDTSNCNNLVVDENTGSGSLSMDKDGDDYVISGLIYWQDIKINDDGSLNLDDYKKSMKKMCSDSKKCTDIIDKIVSELGLTQKLISSATSTIASDAKVGYCLNGRTVSGTRIASTSGRYPNLLSQSNRIIAEQAIRLVKNNYNTKLNSLLAEAGEGVDDDKAERLCANMAFDNLVGEPNKNEDSENVNQIQEANKIKSDSSNDTPLEKRIYNNLSSVKISNNGVYENKINNFNYKESVTATFNRETNICRLEQRVQNCVKAKRSGNKKKAKCKTWADPVTTVKEIQL